MLYSTHTLSSFNLLSFFIFTKTFRGPEGGPEGRPEGCPEEGVQVLSTPITLCGRGILVGGGHSSVLMYM